MKTAEIKEEKQKLRVVSYTLRGRNKTPHEDIITDEYWTEHKNLDGSILKIKVMLNQ